MIYCWKFQKLFVWVWYVIVDEQITQLLEVDDINNKVASICNYFIGSREISYGLVVTDNDGNS